MKKDEIEKRELLSKELEMNFEETLELFSEETLGTMMMTELVGGTGMEGINFSVCTTNKGVCTNKNCPCKYLDKSQCSNKNCSGIY